MLFVLSTGSLTAHEYIYHRKPNWMAYVPVWTLPHELNGQSSNNEALAELTDRLKKKKLSFEQVAAVADKCLAVQADRSQKCNAAWGDFLDDARAAGQLDNARWIEYARNGLNFSVHLGDWGLDHFPTSGELARARLIWVSYTTEYSEACVERQGNPQCRFGSRANPFNADLKFLAYQIDGVPADSAPFEAGQSRRAGPAPFGFVVYKFPRLDRFSTRDLTFRRHTLTTLVRISMYENDIALASYVASKPAELDVIDQSTMSPPLRDQAMHDDVRKSVSCRLKFDAIGTPLSAILEVTNPPIRMDFHLIIRDTVGLQMLDMGCYSVDCGETGKFSIPLAALPAGTGCVIFTLVPERAPADADSPVWPEVINQELLWD